MSKPVIRFRKVYAHAAYNRECRLNHRCTKKELATRSGLSKKTIRRMEDPKQEGRPMSFKKFERLTKQGYGGTSIRGWLHAPRARLGLTDASKSCSVAYRVDGDILVSFVGRA